MRRADGLLTYILVFTGLGERQLLLREDYVSEEKYRASVADFEASALPTRLAQPPLIVTNEEWRHGATRVVPWTRSGKPR